MIYGVFLFVIGLVYGHSVAEQQLKLSAGNEVVVYGLKT
jgi:hypothetical protein